MITKWRAILCSSFNMLIVNRLASCLRKLERTSVHWRLIAKATHTGEVRCAFVHENDSFMCVFSLSGEELGRAKARPRWSGARERAPVFRSLAPVLRHSNGKGTVCSLYEVPNKWVMIDSPEQVPGTCLFLPFHSFICLCCANLYVCWFWLCSSVRLFILNCCLFFVFVPCSSFVIVCMFSSFCLCSSVPFFIRFNVHWVFRFQMFVCRFAWFRIRFFR